jgi:DNA-directed RNA polymerase subunit beta
MNLKKGTELQLFGKSIPISLLIAASHTKEELDLFYSTLGENVPPEINAVKEACLKEWENKTEQQLISEIGLYFSTNRGDEFKKGKGVIFSIKAAYYVDIFSQPLFKTNSILFEFIQSIYDGQRSDTDISRKRIRFLEYVLSPLIKKIYDMMITLNNGERGKFQIPKTIIFDHCNKSDVVRFSFPINPITELAMLAQCTLTGPGGFKKGNVPSHLRDLDKSQFGYICPADTPDRSGCGVTLNMVPTVKLTENGHFRDPDKEVITSYPISLTPFLEHNDQTRLQMASNHAKQAILLKKSEKPLIRSGTEGLYHDYSTFLQRAKKAGEVKYINNEIMIVSYDDNITEAFQIGYKNIFQGVIDIIKPKFNTGDKFNIGDILCESSFYKDGELSLGHNLNCVIGMWDGFNYEDGIVISRSVAEEKFTSIHHIDLAFIIDPSQILLSLTNEDHNPLPKVGQKLIKGDPYARIKTINYDEGIETLTLEPTELKIPINCEVIDVSVFPNYWNKKTIDHNRFIEKMLIKQTERFAIIENKLSELMNNNEEEVYKILKLLDLTRLDCMARRGKYSIKGQSINGTMIRIKAKYEEKIGIGDKITNRHGNKGVISLIEEDENMPVLPDGRKIEIIINPLGIVSRMNAGQLFELHLSEALFNAKNKMKTMPEKDGEEFLYKLIELTDNTSDKWVSNKLKSEYQDRKLKYGYEKAIDGLYFIQPPFNSITPKQLKEIMTFTGAQFKYMLYHPNSKVNINTPLSAGKMYFSKLVHRASDKMSARSIGPYSKKTLQPLGGKSRGGGHRCGEMEVWALMAHGANNLLKDFLTVQSDSPGKKNKLLAKMLSNPELSENDSSDNTPQSLRLFKANLKVLGLELET